MHSDDLLPLTPAQLGLWFLQQVNGPAVTTTCQYAEVRGDRVDADALAAAVDAVAGAIPELWTRIHPGPDGTVRQQPGGHDPVPTAVVDLSAAGAQAPDRAAAVIDGAAATGVDPAVGPGFHAQVLALSRSRAIIVLRIHHMFVDAYGYALLWRWIGAAHRAAVAHRPAPSVDATPICAVVTAAREYDRSPAAVEDRAYWSATLAGAPAATGFSAAPMPAPSAVAAQVRTHRHLTSPGLATALSAMAAPLGGTWGDAVTAAVAATLGRTRGSRETVLGHPLMSRLGTAAARALTTAVNVVPLRTPTVPAMTAAQQTAAVIETARRAADHGTYRGEDIHRDLALGAHEPGPVGPDVNITPFAAAVDFGDGRATITARARGPVRDLRVTVSPASGGALELLWEADAARYDEAALAAVAGRVGRMVEAFADGDRATGAVDLLSAADRAAVTARGAAPAAPSSAPDVPERIAEAVAAHPGRTALIAGAQRLTYAEFGARVGALADRLAPALAAADPGEDPIVAVALPRGADLPIALTAVWAAGAAYLPIDPDFPPARIRLMLGDARPVAVVTTAETAATLGVDPALPVIEPAAAAPGASGFTPVPVHPRRSAYVIYTSGSTGRPKGVVVDRGALARFTDTAIALTAMTSTDRLLAVTTVSFDIAVLELFAPLVCGAAVVVADEDQARDPKALAALARDEQVTVMQATPSLWSGVVERGAQDLRALRVLVGGEALAPDLAGALAGAGAAINVYGPTEATVWCTSTAVTLPWRGSIGQPFPGTGVHVLDAALQPVGPDGEGELYLSGAQLARGYLRRPDLTAAAFVADPAGGGLLYRTGDLVRWLPGGDLEYVSRTDDQVKIRGHRVELGAVEAAAAEIAEVGQAVAGVHRRGADAVLALYVRPAADDAEVDTAAVRAHLAAQLPDYMVPTAVLVLSEFPLTPNLKVDRRALPAPSALSAVAGRPPRPGTETVLAAAVAEVLGLDRPAPADADFFALGGTSLAATRLTVRIRRDTGVDLSLRAVFDAPTVAELAALVDAATPQPAESIAGRAGAPSAIPLLDRSGPLPMSSAQQRLWLHTRMHGADATYNVPHLIELTPHTGRIGWDDTAMRAAIAALHRRHEILSSVVVERGGIGHLHLLTGAEAEPAVHFDTLPADPGERAELVGRLARRPFDLRTEPPVRWHLLGGADGTVAVLMVLHHIAADEWSVDLLTAQLLDAYRARIGGADTVWEEHQYPSGTPVGYVDHTAWARADERSARGRARRETDLAFWRARLAGAPTEGTWPVDRPRPPMPSHRGGEVTVTVPTELSARLQAAAAAAGATPFMTAHAAVAALAGRLGVGPDVVLGAPTTGRADPIAEQLVGFFIETVVLRTDLGADPTAAQLLAAVRADDLAVYAHARIRFDEVVEALAPPRSPARHPLFQVMVQHRVQPPAPTLPGCEVRTGYVSTGTAKFDLTFEFIDLPAPESRTVVRIEYAADLYDHDTVAALGDRLLTVLDWLGDPAGTMPLSALDVRTPAERARTAEPAATPVAAPVHAMLCRATAAHPDVVALRTAEGEWTYTELATRARRTARALVARGVGPESIVAIALDRSADAVVALWAIAAAGAAYLPIDPHYPSDRIALMLADAAPVLAICAPDAALPVGAATTVITAADLAAEARGLPGGSLTDDERTAPLDPAHPSYVVYTSGSTGVPKGVVGTAGALAVRLAWQRDTVPAPQPDVRLAKSSLSFIDGSTELLAGLVSGATMVLADDEQSRSTAALAAAVTAHGVGQLTAVPSVAADLLRHHREAAGRVRTWFLSGEPLGDDLVDALVAVGGAEVINSYGTSEVAGDVTVWRRDVDAAHSPVRIGTAVPGTRTLVLDAALRPVPDGVIGELYVDTVQSARGYLDRPGLTAERFVADPTGGGGRVFRTGDRVRRDTDGRLQFLGRVDGQIGLRGLRIEPGEIETALRADDGIVAAAVTVFDRAGGAPQLAALVVPAAGTCGDELVARSRAGLRRRLPAHLIPEVLVEVDALPLLPNGKLDRGALPSVAARAVAARPVGARGPSRPRTADEDLVAAVLAELLGADDPVEADPEADFFDLGGTSLLAGRLIAVLRERTGAALTVREVFDRRTVAGLAALVTARRRDQTPAPGVGGPRRSDLPAVTPMSSAQQRLWFLFRLEGPRPTRNLAFTVRLDGPVDRVALAAALTDLVDRHEPLRTVFRDSSEADRARGIIGLAEVLETAAVAPRLVHLDPGDDPVAAARRPFDLAAEPPLRVFLQDLGPGEDGVDRHRLLLSIHHIAADEQSARPLMADLTAAYARRIDAPGAAPAAPAPTAVRYRDFARWHNARLGPPAAPTERLAQGLAYWRRVLDGLPTEIALPWDRPRPAVADHRGDAVAAELPAAAVARLRAHAHGRGATMFMTVHAAVIAVLHRFGAGTDLVVGTPVAGRPASVLDELVGYFVNTIVLRTPVHGDETFARLLDRVREVDLEAFAHDAVPFDRLVEQQSPARSLARHPLFQTMVQYRAPFDPVEFAGAEASPEFLETGVAEFDLRFEFAERTDGAVRARVEYATELFDRATADRLLTAVLQLLGAVAEEPYRVIGDIALLPPDQERALAAAAHGVHVADPGAVFAADTDDRTVPALVLARADRDGAAPALIVDDGPTVTYAALAAAVRALAERLRAVGVRRGDVVVIDLPRSAATVIAMLAVQHEGAAYLPLEQDLPAARRTAMLADAAPIAVISAVSAPDPDPGVGPTPDGCPPTVVRVDARGTAVGAGAPTTGADTAAEVPAGGVRARPGDPAYVLYTSGSTGRPKGVRVSQGAVVNRLAWAQSERPLTVRDRLLQKTPTGFDVSVWELFWPLAAGAGLVIPAPGAHRDPELLRAVIETHTVTVVHFVPSMLRPFLDGLERSGHGRAGDDRWRTVTDVLCSGEALPVELVDRFHRLVDARLVNLYGPTEAAVDVTATEVRAGAAFVPIGAPVWNTGVHVLGADLRPVPPGVVGELYLSGPQLADGYHGRGGLTAERFVADPAGTGARIYRTGDRVRRRPDPITGDWTLEYLGRTDGQVKLRGQRVELGDVEAVMGGIAGVGQAVAAVRTAPSGADLLAAYVTASPGAVIDPETVRTDAGALLPEYMVPGAVVVLETMPLGISGKVDRARLPDPVSIGGGRGPDGPVETLLCALFARSLRLDGAETDGPIGADDDFFALGGDSIISIHLVGEAAEAGLALTPQDVFRHRTPAGIARALAERSAADTAPVDPQAADPGAAAPAETVTAYVSGWVHRLQDSGRDPVGVGAAVAVPTPPGVGAEEAGAALAAVVRAHDGLRLRLHSPADAPWTLTVADADPAPADPVPVHALDDHDDDRLRSAAAAEAAHLVAGLDPAVAVVAATLLTRSGDSGLLVVAGHGAAVDEYSWPLLETALGAALSGTPTAPATASIVEVGRRFTRRGLDPAGTAEIGHWLTVCGTDPDPGGAADDPGGADRSVTAGAAACAAVPGVDPLHVETAALAALLAALDRCGRPRGRIELRRDLRPALTGPGLPDARAVIGRATVDVPVLAAAPESDPPFGGGDGLAGARATAAAALAAVPGDGAGFEALRYIDPQTSAVLAAAGQAPIGLRVRPAAALAVGPGGDGTHRLSVDVAYAHDTGEAAVTVSAAAARWTTAQCRDLVEAWADCWDRIAPAAAETAR